MIGSKQFSLTCDSSHLLLDGVRMCSASVTIIIESKAENISRLMRFRFLPRDINATQYSAVFAVAMYPSVRPSVCHIRGSYRNG